MGSAMELLIYAASRGELPFHQQETDLVPVQESQCLHVFPSQRASLLQTASVPQTALLTSRDVLFLEVLHFDTWGRRSYSSR